MIGRPPTKMAFLSVWFVATSCADPFSAGAESEASLPEAGAFEASIGVQDGGANPADSLDASSAIPSDGALDALGDGPNAEFARECRGLGRQVPIDCIPSNASGITLQLLVDGKPVGSLPDTLTGSSTVAQVFVQNTNTSGTGTVTFAANAGDAVLRLDTGTCTGPLAPRGTPGLDCHLGITFTPTAARKFAVEVTSNSEIYGNSTLCFQANGLERVRLDPENYCFPDEVPLGSVRKQKVTVTSKVGESVGPVSPRIGAGGAAFSVVDADGCTTSPLSAKGESCSFWVEFTPLREGIARGTLVLDRAGNPAGIQMELRGYGQRL